MDGNHLKNTSSMIFLDPAIGGLSCKRRECPISSFSPVNKDSARVWRQFSATRRLSDLSTGDNSTQLPVSTLWSISQGSIDGLFVWSKLGSYWSPMWSKAWNVVEILVADTRYTLYQLMLVEQLTLWAHILTFIGATWALMHWSHISAMVDFYH